MGRIARDRSELYTPVMLGIAYVIVQMRRRRYALRFTTVDLLDEIAPDMLSAIALNSSWVPTGHPETS